MKLNDRTRKELKCIRGFFWAMESSRSRPGVVVDTRRDVFSQNTWTERRSFVGSQARREQARRSPESRASRAEDRNRERPSSRAITQRWQAKFDAFWPSGRAHGWGSVVCAPRAHNNFTSEAFGMKFVFFFDLAHASPRDFLRQVDSACGGFRFCSSDCGKAYDL